MVRWLSIGVISYMILGIIWWGVLLYQKNEQIFALQSAERTEVLTQDVIDKERKQQVSMIMGEGLVLISLLLLGIYIINRSANREILAAKQQNDFLLSVSHELKSPIAAIKLALQTLSRSKLSAEKQSKFMNSALSDSNRLEKLVQNILLTTNIDNTSLELYKMEVELVNLLNVLIEQYTRNGQTVQVNFTSTEDKLLIQADKYTLSQAIGNILDNAIKYKDQDSSIEINLTNTSNLVICKISNQGATIPTDQLKKIFDKFYRVDTMAVRKKEGTGIGLYITRKIINAHGGTISVESKNNLNTFTISLPIIDE